MTVEEQVREELQAHAERVDVVLDAPEQILGRAHGQRIRTGMVAATAVAALIAVTAWLTDPALPVPDVVDRPSPDGAITTIEPVLLDGTRLRLSLPSQIVSETQGERWLAGSLYAAGSLEEVDRQTPGWRLDVRAGDLDQILPDARMLELPADSSAREARLQAADSMLGLQFGRWVAIVSGDILTDEHTALLVDGIELSETPDGDVLYTGRLPLWQVDSPELRLGGDDTAISIFFRGCSDPGTTETDSGLAIRHHVEDSNRTGHLTVICSHEVPLEIWLESPHPIDDAVLADVTADVVTAGSVLTGINTGRSPGSRPNTNLDTQP